MSVMSLLYNFRAAIVSRSQTTIFKMYMTVRAATAWQFVYLIQNVQCYIPTLRLGVCVTLEPAPMPECLGVPGTMTFAFDPEAVLTAKVSSAACLAVLGTVEISEERVATG